MLATVPLFDTQNVIYMNYMFSECYSLVEVPLFNTIKVQYMDSMFNACISLTTIPQFNTSAMRQAVAMFSGCLKLTTVPQLNYSAVTNGNFRNIFENCSALTSVIDFRSNTISITTNFTGFMYLSSITGFFAPTNINMNINITNSGLDATALNAMFTALPTVSGKTLTITGSVGAATCDITIATAKGWTVVR